MSCDSYYLVELLFLRIFVNKFCNFVFINDLKYQIFMFIKVNYNVFNENEFISLYLCYKLYFIMYFFDIFLMNEIFYCF